MAATPQAQTAQPPTSIPTEFLRRASRGAEAAADWLARSIAACGGKGSSAYYSRWYLPLRGWQVAYPETTGYIIPTLIAYGKQQGRDELIQLALRQADWILTLQQDSGALPGGYYLPDRPMPPSIFNTGQMIKGLLAAFDETGVGAYLDGAARAARWLAEEVDPQAGYWQAHAYVAGYSPAYYTRVAWPMLEVHARRPDALVRERAMMALNTVLGWQLDNGAIRNWAFTAKAPAFTHTVAYTIRGLLESARLLGADGAPFAAAARKSADAIARRAELRGRVAGAYDLQLKGRAWYTCLTGNCQLAIIWMKLFEQTGDGRYLSIALKAIEFVMDRQKLHPRDANLHGAIAGSAPLWGRYLILRYPNWAAKFYLDSLMLAQRLVGQLLERGPCAWS